MKITIELPDTTGCAFVSYVFSTGTVAQMAVKQIGTDGLHGGEVIVCESEAPTEKGGDDNA